MIVFESDRGGGPQLYIMREDGEHDDLPDGRRETDLPHHLRASGRFTDPVWSPRGDWIAFSASGRGQFSIGVIQPDGTGMRILTDGYQDEEPDLVAQRPCDRLRAYGSTGAGPKLWSVDLTGRNLRRMPTPRDATNPTWGPLLKVDAVLSSKR